MKKRIGTILLTGVIISNLVGCGEDKELTTKDKKQVIEQLQEEVKKEESVKISKDITDEEYALFRNSFETWLTYEDTVTSMDTHQVNRREEVTNQTTLLGEELLKATPKEFEKDVKTMLENNIDFLNNSFENYTLGDTETYGSYMEKRNKVDEYITVLKNTFEKYDKKYNYVK